MKNLTNKWNQLNRLQKLTIVFIIMAIAEVDSFIIVGHFFGVSLPVIAKLNK